MFLPMKIISHSTDELMRSGDAAAIGVHLKRPVEVQPKVSGEEMWCFLRFFSLIQCLGRPFPHRGVSLPISSCPVAVLRFLLLSFGLISPVARLASWRQWWVADQGRCSCDQSRCSLAWFWKCINSGSFPFGPLSPALENISDARLVDGFRNHLTQDHIRVMSNCQTSTLRKCNSFASTAGGFLIWRFTYQAWSDLGRWGAPFQMCSFFSHILWLD